MVLSPGVCALSALASFLGDGAPPRWREFDTRPSRFGEADGDGLFGGARTVFSLANVVYLFADEFACLSARGFAGALGGTGSFERCFFWHGHPFRCAIPWLHRFITGPARLEEVPSRARY